MQFIGSANETQDDMTRTGNALKPLSSGIALPAFLVILHLPLCTNISRLQTDHLQNLAKAASIDVTPKLSLKATLSSTADRKSIPLIYRCNRIVGIILYP